MTRTTWGGRLPGGLAPEAWIFLHSLPHDRFLWPYDVRGTLAHVAGLRDASLLTAEEADRLTEELEGIAEAPELIEDDDEDVHSAIERVLTERLGDLGRKVHTARSRNDQVATALRLWAVEATADATAAVGELTAALLERAAEHTDTLCPGYTHLQRAQPVTLGHHLCAHATALVRDLGRLSAARDAADISPLGAGALATSTLGVDPEVAREALGFGGLFTNSLDAVSDRDFLADAAYACAMTLTHLSRIAEEIVLWSTTEFGFLRLPDRWATGSSMMPQKKNPDVGELARGHTGLAVGALTGLLVTMKGLPLAYDRDLQADKQHLRGVVETTAMAARALAGLIGDARFDTDRLADACAEDALLATDLAEELVKRGVPFRTAHEQVGAVVKAATDAGVSIADAIRSDPGRLEPLTAGEAVGILDPHAAVRRRDGRGGPSPASVEVQIRELRQALAQT